MPHATHIFSADAAGFGAPACGIASFGTWTTAPHARHLPLAPAALSGACAVFPHAPHLTVMAMMLYPQLRWTTDRSPQAPAGPFRRSGVYGRCTSEYGCCLRCLR